MNKLATRLIHSLIISAACMASGAAIAADLVVRSGEKQAVLLELYTSEGCSSCPPADRFMTAVKDSVLENDQVVPLAFHVTYWDYIGWRDKFGDKDFDDRQRDIAAFNRTRTIYTPQFVFNGDDFRRMRHFVDELNTANQARARIGLEASLTRSEEPSGKTQFQVDLSSTRFDTSKGQQDLDIFVAIYENNLSTEVHRGENAGRKLNHDYVVRHFDGPFLHEGGKATYETQAIIPINPDWNLNNAGFAIFAQDRRSGRILQATSGSFGLAQ